MRPQWLGPYQQLRAAAFEVGRSWCGSWLPRFSALYDRDLMPLPLPLRMQAAATPEQIPPELASRCRPWTVQQIRQAIHARAGHPDDAALRQIALTASGLLNDAIVAAVAALECEAAARPADQRLAGYLLAAREIEAPDAAAFVERCRPATAHLSGAADAEPPPHIAEMARLEALRSPFDALHQTACLMRSAALHLEAATGSARAVLRQHS